MACTSQQLTNWLELPSDITTNILRRISVIDIFENVEKVCTTWHKICKDPTMWRVIHMECSSHSNERLRYRKICKLAVDRSQGQLVDMTIVSFCDDELLWYVAQRSSQLKRLEIAEGLMYRSWNEALKKFPLLEELNIYLTTISKEAIETVGRYCPLLKTFRLNRSACLQSSLTRKRLEYCFIMVDNEFAKAIGKNLSNLRHLEVIGSRVSNVGLQDILDGCCHLESLDLRECWNIDLNKQLLKRCSEQIKHLKLPGESLEGCSYIEEYEYDDEFICTCCYYESRIVLE